MMKRLAVFASGNGSNYEAIAQACADGRIQASVALLVCDKPGAYVLERAKRFGVETFVFNPKAYARKADFEREIADRMDALGIDLVCLAGYMRILGEEMLSRYKGRIINIHPALLPKYGGKGMHGMHVHEAVVAAGEVETGITIHLVDEQYDHGKTLFQAKCEVLPCDTALDVAAKIHLLEQEHFPEVVDGYLSNLLQQ